MEFDTKQRVLLAIYSEYQKDIPQMDNVTWYGLGLDLESFGFALEKLRNEGLINGPAGCVNRGGLGHRVVSVHLGKVMMSSAGIEYVETKLAIDKTLSGKEKVQKVFEEAGKFGLEQVKDIASKVLAEMAKSVVGIN